MKIKLSVIAAIAISSNLFAADATNITNSQILSLKQVSLSDNINAAVGFGVAGANIEIRANDAFTGGQSVTRLSDTAVVIGHYAASGNANSNTINMSGGTLNALYGGYAKSGDASLNTINYSGGAVRHTTGAKGGTIYGGFSEGGSVEGNIVNITGGAGPTNAAYGGASSATSGSVKGNIVNITGSGGIGGGHGDYAIIGGTARNSGVSVEGNTVYIDTTGGIAGRFIYGGYNGSGVNSVVSGNRVIIKKASGAGYVKGGMSLNGKANGNIVEFSGANVSKITGSIGKIGASGNKVTISGGSINDVHGGAVASNTHVNSFTSGEANDNEIVVNGGAITNLIGGQASTNSTLNGNKISINTGSVIRVYGALAGDRGTLARNKISIGGGSVGEVRGASAGANSNASENEISISGGNFSSSVYGTYASGVSTIKGNSVTISGGRFSSTPRIEVGRIDFAEGDAEISGNVVSVSNLSSPTQFSQFLVHGGTMATKANATGTVKINGNTISIKNTNNTVRDVKGGEIDLNGGGAEMKGNVVNIENVNGALNYVQGARVNVKSSNVTSVNLTNYVVNIKGTNTLSGGAFYGTYSNFGTWSGESAVLSGNKVNINDARILGSNSTVYGALAVANGKGSLVKNEVNMNGDNSSVYRIIGAFGRTENSENVVNLNGGEVRSHVYGSWGTALGGKNVVNFKGGYVKGRYTEAILSDNRAIS